MDILTKFVGLFISPRFKALYWTAGITFAVDLVGLISERIPDLGIPEWTAVLVIGGLGQITKALTNLLKDKPMGFAPKK
jgi:hypothetical protein